MRKWWILDTNTADKTGYAGTDKLLLGIVLSVLTFALFSQTIINLAPTVRTDLGIDVASSNLAVSITALFSGMFVVLLGGLSDRFGKLKMIRIGLALSIAGSALIALSPAGTAAFLMTGRILQGLSAACILPSTLALIKVYYQGAQRQRAVSFYSMGSWGGSGMTSLFGGIVASAIGWRWIFWLSIAIAVLSFVLLLGTPESKNTADTHGKKYDIPGIVTFILGMVALNLFIGQGSNLGWLNPVTIGLALGAVVSLTAFYFIERSHKEPFIDFSLFSIRMYRGATLSNFLLNSAAGTLVVTLSVVQIGAGFTSFQAGLLTIGYLIAILTTIRIGEKLLQRWGARRPMILGSSITGLGILLLTSTFLLTAQYRVVAIVAFTLFGAGLGFYATPSTDAALSTVPEEQAGAASGIYKMSSSLGSALGIAISAAIFTGLSGAEISFAEGLFLGRTDNIAVRLAAMIALLYNLFMVMLAIVSILATIPPEKRKDQAAG